MNIESLFEGKMKMEYTSSSMNIVDTSLNLNLKPLRVLHDDSNPQVGPSNFFEFTGQIPVQEDKAGALVEELKRVNDENKKLTQMLTVICENYNALRNQMMEYMDKNDETDSKGSRKRKSGSVIDGGGSESSSSDEDSSKKLKEDHIKPKVSRVYVTTEASDTSLIVKDGYQWRKYGQKVTKDNPYPRAYYRCALAPTCPVKKKVQRSVKDHSILVATYEGEHNHEKDAIPSSTRNVSVGSSVPCLTTSNSSSAPSNTITLDLTRTNPNDELETPKRRRIDSPELQKSLVEQMASSLTKDPNFRAVLAAAISGRILQPN